MPHGSEGFTTDLTLRTGDQIAFTFDSAHYREEVSETMNTRVLPCDSLRSSDRSLEAIGQLKP